MLLEVPLGTIPVPARHSRVHEHREHAPAYEPSSPQPRTAPSSASSSSRALARSPAHSRRCCECRSRRVADPCAGGRRHQGGCPFQERGLGASAEVGHARRARERRREQLGLVELLGGRQRPRARRSRTRRDRRARERPSPRQSRIRDAERGVVARVLQLPPPRTGSFDRRSDLDEEPEQEGLRASGSRDRAGEELVEHGVRAGAALPHHGGSRRPRGALLATGDGRPAESAEARVAQALPRRRGRRASLPERPPRRAASPPPRRARRIESARWRAALLEIVARGD